MEIQAVDLEEIRTEVRESLGNVDWDEIRRSVEEAMGAAAGELEDLDALLEDLAVGGSGVI